MVAGTRLGSLIDAKRTESGTVGDEGGWLV